ncbi:MAG: PqqD family protein [Deltaproteobacteria bacterium]|nr:PqqD family protein [Deltaproteobacteria bacterium]
MKELLSKRVSVPADVLINEIAGESVLLNLDGGRYFGLDDVGTDMWKALTTSASIAQALAQLTALYDADAALLKSDLENLVTRLAEYGLIKFDDS